MKLRQLIESFVISNDEFEDYLDRATEQLTTEIQSGKNARDAVHELSVQFSKMHNSAYAAYTRMSDSLFARLHTLELEGSESPDMGMEPDMGADLGGDTEMLNDPMGNGMEMDVPPAEDMPMDSEMDDYNAVMANEPEVTEAIKKNLDEGWCAVCGHEPCACTEKSVEVTEASNDNNLEFQDRSYRDGNGNTITDIFYKGKFVGSIGKHRPRDGRPEGYYLIQYRPHSIPSGSGNIHRYERIDSRDEAKKLVAKHFNSGVEKSVGEGYKVLPPKEAELDEVSTFTLQRYKSKASKVIDNSKDEREVKKRGKDRGLNDDVQKKSQEETNLSEDIKAFAKKMIAKASSSDKWHDLMRAKYGKTKWDSYWKSNKNKDFWDRILDTGFNEEAEVDDRDELTKKLFPRKSREEMEKADREKNREANQKRFMKPGKPSRSREWGAYESVDAEEVTEASNDTYAMVSYNYSDDWGSIELIKDGETVEDWNDYFGANETGNPLAAKFVELCKKHGIDPTEIDILSGDDEDIHPIRGRKMGKFNGKTFKWNAYESVDKEKYQERPGEAKLHDIQWPDEDMAQHAENAIRHGNADDAYGYVYTMTYNRDHRDWMRDHRDELIKMFASYGLATESEVAEGWETLPAVDADRYGERPGLEGPFQTRVGKVVYYDPKEGAYYDPDSDMYLSYEEWKELDGNSPLRNEAEEKFAGWLAFYNGKKLEIRKNQAKDIYNAKLKAIKHFNVPKSKQGLLAIKPAYEELNEAKQLNEFLPLLAPVASALAPHIAGAAARAIGGALVRRGATALAQRGAQALANRGLTGAARAVSGAAKGAKAAARANTANKAVRGAKAAANIIGSLGKGGTSSAPTGKDYSTLQPSLSKLNNSKYDKNKK